jgi:hypothetical protein
MERNLQASRERALKLTEHIRREQEQTRNKPKIVGSHHTTFARIELSRSDRTLSVPESGIISINSAGPVTRDGPAEILVSATSQSCRDMLKFLGNFRAG